MRILITGSGGFLGSNLCNLLSKEHQILAVSRQFDNIISNENVEFAKYDLSEYLSLDKKFYSFMPDIVIHCAWQGGNSSKDTGEIWQSNNIVANNNILKLCSEFKINHFIGFGSSAEFGYYEEKFNEESICKPVNMYGIAKYSARLFSERYCLDNGIKFSWVRPVFTYGPCDVETRLIPKTIKSFLNNEKIVLNSCSATVDYLYVEDFCNAVKNIIDFELQGDFLISSDEEYQVKDIVQMIYKMISPNSELVFDSSLDNEKLAQYICGTSEKLKKMTSWRPSLLLKQGLKKTISYYQHRV
jgi:nucleoside-diphosphate-sugar epimerase